MSCFVYCIRCQEEIFSDLQGRNDTTLIYEQVELGKSHFVQFLYKLHMTYKINRFVDLPLKNIWLRMMPLDRIDFLEGKENYLVIMDSALTFYTPRYLSELRKKCKVILLLFNPYSNLKKNKPWMRIYSKCQFDLILSAFDVKDPEEIGSLNTYHVYSKALMNDVGPSTDIFFLGLDKDRHKKLIGIFDKAERSGLLADFWIINFEGQEKRTGVKYSNNFVPYGEYLKLINQTRCILEIVQNDQRGPTLRAFEAVAYGKHLLTNNHYVTKFPFYNPQYMHIYKDINDINLDFLKKEKYVEPKYDYDNEFSPIHLNEQIINYFKKN